MADCLVAMLRGEDTDEAYAGAVTLADTMHELRETRRSIQALVKALTK